MNEKKVKKLRRQGRRLFGQYIEKYWKEPLFKRIYLALRIIFRA